MKAKMAVEAPSTKNRTAIRNRIVGRGLVAAKELKSHPMNARLHPEPQRLALMRVLGDVGWVQDVIVNKRTGLMLNGHLRQQIAAERGEKIPVLYVDLDPREEKLILASLDPIGEMAVLDEGQLAALLAELDLPSDGEIAQLLNSLLEETIEETPKDSGSSAAVPNDRTPRQLGDRKTQIKPVLYVNQVAVFEQALRMTHESNRGKAIMAVCDFYIRANS